MPAEIRLDALLPPEMAKQAEEVGARKCLLAFWPLVALSVLAGSFIALGAMFSTTVIAGASPSLPYGLVRLLAGVTFCLGLILVVVGGAELFTGNALIVMAWASRKVTALQVARQWAIVYVGNFAGATATAAMVFLAGQYGFGGGSVGAAVLEIARAKTALGFGQAVWLGILCNTLVCLAVWLCLGARGPADKVLSVLFPVTAFVAAGFEHSVANMYYLPLGLLVRSDAAFLGRIGKTPADFPTLTLDRVMAGNLLPVTLGNLIGGVVLVGLVYWFVYLRARSGNAAANDPGPTR